MNELGQTLKDELVVRIVFIILVALGVAFFIFKVLRSR